MRSSVSVFHIVLFNINNNIIITQCSNCQRSNIISQQTQKITATLRQYCNIAAILLCLLECYVYFLM